jgi:hypothetical protein
MRIDHLRDKREVRSVGELHQRQFVTTGNRLVGLLVIVGLDTGCIDRDRAFQVDGLFPLFAKVMCPVIDCEAGHIDACPGGGSQASMYVTMDRSICLSVPDGAGSSPRLPQYR